jgi:hypothetical protein
MAALLLTGLLSKLTKPRLRRLIENFDPKPHRLPRRLYVADLGGRRLDLGGSPILL